MKPTSQIFSKFWLPLALCIYALIFLFRLPPQLVMAGIQITDWLIILIACGIIYFCFKKPGWGWKIFALALTLMIFTLPLLRIWENAESNYNLVLGLLPWSDAAGYFSDAVSLLQGSLFGEFSGHRPLFASFLAVLLQSSHGNIQISLVILTIINGLAVFLFAWEIVESFGPFAGAGMILLLQMFYRQFAAVLLTEQLGIPLGLMALSSLFYAIRRKNKWFFSAGLFFLTLALFARAGAFFVIPAVLLLGCFLFKENGHFSFKNNSILLFALLAAWGLNALLGNIVAVPGTVALGNFSYTLYGQAVGGKGWTQVFIDHPEISMMPDAERTQTVYRLALDQVMRSPSGLATGFFRAWRDYFIPSIFAGFGYIQLGDKYSSPVIQVILTIFLLLGLVQCWRYRDQAIYLLLLSGIVGIFLSIPFIPPSESANMRVYAVTIAIPALITCIGILTLFQKHRPVVAIDSSEAYQRIRMVSVLGITLALLSTVGAMTIKTLSRIPAPEPITCQSAEVPLQFQLSPQGYVQITTNEASQRTYVPNVSARDFRQSMRKFPGIYHTFSDALIATITPPVLITYTRNMLTGKFFWLIAPAEISSYSGKTVRACGQVDNQDFSVIYIKTIK
jgi:hypothetical protein